MPLKKPQCVYVEWVDACTEVVGWASPSEVETVSRDADICQTIGWLIDKTKTWVAIAHTIDQGANVADPFKIPRGSIVKMRTIKV